MPEDLVSIIFLWKTPQLLVDVVMISTQGFSLRQFSEKITHFLGNPDNITDFLRKYLVTEDAIKMYVNHMKLLSLTKEKRSKYKAAQREEARKTYKEYDWEEMFHERSLS